MKRQKQNKAEKHLFDNGCKYFLSCEECPVKCYLDCKGWEFRTQILDLFVAFGVEKSATPASLAIALRRSPSSTYRAIRRYYSKKRKD